MLPQDQQRFLIATVVSIPLSLGLRYMPSLLIRKLYSLILATALQFYVYKHETWLVIALHVAMYFLIKMKGRKCGALVTGVGLFFMSAYHIYRMTINYGGWQLDASTIIMLAVVKYSLFAFAYQDGATPAGQHKFEHRKHDSLVTLPNFMDFLGFCQFLPTAVLNTPFQYVRYDNYMTRSAQFEFIPLNGSLLKAGKDFGIAVICIAIFALQMIWMPISNMKVEGFMQSSAAYVVWYSFWSVWLVKFKYYFGWKLSMLPLHIAGVTYDPNENTKADQWLGIQTCNPWEIESTIHLREKISNWNMPVQEWLRKCVYERLSLSRSTAQLVTFAISAFWHGFYEGYYLTFGFWFLQMYISGIIFKWSQDKTRPFMQLYLKAEPYSFWAIWLFWNWLFAHNGMYFHLLEYTYCFEMLAYFKYCSPIIMIMLLFAFTIKGKGKGNKGSKGLKSNQTSSNSEEENNKKDE